MSLLFFTCTFTFQVNYHRKKEYKNDKNNEQKKSNFLFYRVTESYLINLLNILLYIIMTLS